MPEDGYGYTNALDDWVYNDSNAAEKENKKSSAMPPPRSKRDIVRLDVGLSDRKRKWEEMCRGAGTSDASIEFLIESVSMDVAMLQLADVT